MSNRPEPTDFNVTLRDESLPRSEIVEVLLRLSSHSLAPGDRYLCIVPGGFSKAGQVVLPFEGDNRLSVILSKALMLTEDDKITAPDIVSQLQR